MSYPIPFALDKMMERTVALKNLLTELQAGEYVEMPIEQFLNVLVMAKSIVISEEKKPEGQMFELAMDENDHKLSIYLRATHEKWMRSTWGETPIDFNAIAAVLIAVYR